MGKNVKSSDLGLHWKQWQGIALPDDVVTQLTQEWEIAFRLELAKREKEDSETDRKIQAARKSSESDPPLHGWNETIPSDPVFRVVRRSQVEEGAVSALAGQSDKDSVNRIEVLLKQLRAAGEFRTLSVVPKLWRSRLDFLERQFPNFRSAVNAVRYACAVAEHNGLAVSLPPMLLNGPPGIGKSLFAERLATEIGTQYWRINMENAEEGSQLVGSSQHWSNTRPGVVFNLVALGATANPVVLVEEIDKAIGRGQDPLNGLLSLLESHSASSFRDQSFPWINLNASRVIWICTSNEGELVSRPIASRLVQFEIPAPSRSETEGIVETLFNQAVESNNVRDIPLYLSQGAKQELAKGSPREARLKLRVAIGKILFEKRTTILAADVEPVSVAKQSMGFL